MFQTLHGDLQELLIDQIRLRFREIFSNLMKVTVKPSQLDDKTLVLNYCDLKHLQWQPTPVLLPGKSHGWRSLVGCSPWSRKELDTTEWLHFHFSLSCIGEGNGNPLQCSCLENPRDGGAWWAAISGVAQSWTRLKWLSSSKASQTQWTWSWVDSGSWWWTGRPGVLRFMGSQGVGYKWETELNWKSARDLLQKEWDFEYEDHWFCFI